MEEKETVYTVKGMACAHCKATVERQVGALDGVSALEVDLGSGTLRVWGSADPARVADTVRMAGFEIE
ncbi:MAG: cation transporter [Muribaculaceae bacterium]|nr:cation transporter [Muribaculaceae bacterium]